MIQLQLLRQDITKFSLSPIFTLWGALLAVSFAPIFIRLSETELGANATVFNRLFIFALFFGISGAVRSKIGHSQEVKEQKPITTQQWILLVFVGILSVTTLILWAISLEYTSVAKSMLLNNLTPVFTSLGGWLFLNKRFDKRFILGMVIALSGALTLGLEDLHGTQEHLIGDIYALLSAVFLGAYFLVVEQLRYRFSGTYIILWRCVIGSALLIPMVVLTEGQLFPTTWLPWLGVIGLGVISEGFGQRLLADCMEQLSSSFVSLFLLMEPIISAILAWIIFAESLSTTTGLGFIVVITGIYLAQSSKTATKECPV